MILYGIFPLDASLVEQPMAMKIEGAVAVMAFRDEATARVYVKEKLHAGADEYSVRRLTIEQLDDATATAMSHLGLKTYLKIMD